VLQCAVNGKASLGSLGWGCSNAVQTGGFNLDSQHLCLSDRLGHRLLVRGLIHDNALFLKTFPHCPQSLTVRSPFLIRFEAGGSQLLSEKAGITLRLVHSGGVGKLLRLELPRPAIPVCGEAQSSAFSVWCFYTAMGCTCFMCDPRCPLRGAQLEGAVR
jgi:hypothetical protein